MRFSDRNYSVITFASAEVASSEDFQNNSRNLFPTPTVVQALSQSRLLRFLASYFKKSAAIGFGPQALSCNTR